MIAGTTAHPLPSHLLPSLQLNLRGSAGQSFACFLVNGMVVRLVGEANDYVGKGMAGGDVTIVPPPGARAGDGIGQTWQQLGSC